MPSIDSGSRLNSGLAEGLATQNDVPVLMVNSKVTLLGLKVFKTIRKLFLPHSKHNVSPS